MSIKKERSLIKVILTIITLTILLPLLITAQNRSALMTKLRRRGSSLLGRTGNRRGDRVNQQGLAYNAEHELEFRSDFSRSHYLPGLPYWRLDNDMPGVTRQDRFRGAYNGFYYDYYRGRL